jgi:hypothetical protein
LSAPTEGFRLWYSVVAGIGWWLVHITAEASLARIRCSHEGVTWIIDAITLGTALMTGLAIWWCAALIRSHPGGAPLGEDNGGDEGSRARFIGWFGVLTGATSMLLIVWEGAYAHVLRACGA